MSQASFDRDQEWVEPPPALEQEAQTPDTLQVWKEWARSLGALGSSFSQLLGAEARLALGDLRRLLLLALLALPILCLAWIGLCVLLGWWVFELTTSVAGGIGTFFGVQLLTLIAIGVAVRRYQRSLGLPRTREHLAAIMKDFEHGAQRAASASTRD